MFFIDLLKLKDLNVNNYKQTIEKKYDTRPRLGDLAHTFAFINVYTLAINMCKINSYLNPTQRLHRFS